MLSTAFHHISSHFIASWENNHKAFLQKSPDEPLKIRWQQWGLIVAILWKTSKILRTGVDHCVAAPPANFLPCFIWREFLRRVVHPCCWYTLYTHTITHTRFHIHTHTRTHTLPSTLRVKYVYICVYSCIYMYTYIYISMCKYVYIYIYEYMYICIYTCIYIYVYVYIYTYAYTYYICINILIYLYEYAYIPLEQFCVNFSCSHHKNKYRYK